MMGLISFERVSRSVESAVSWCGGSHDVLRVGTRGVMDKGVLIVFDLFPTHCFIFVIWLLIFFVRLGVDKINLIVLVGIFNTVLLSVAAITTACQTPDAQKSQRATTDKLTNLGRRGALEIPIQDSGTGDDEYGKHDKLSRNDLCRVEALQGAVDIFDLQDGGRNEDGHEKVSDWKGQGPPQSVGQQRRDALCAQSRVTTKEADQANVDDQSAVAVPVARDDEQNNDGRSNGKIREKLPPLYQIPNLIWTKLRVIASSTQNNSDGASHGDDDAKGVSLAEALMQHDWSDQAV